MGPTLLVCRIVLAAVFATAGVAKLADRAGSSRAVAEFGVPKRMSSSVGVLLPVAELAVAVALVPLFSARFGALAAAGLLALFIGAIVYAMAHDRAPDCHCFGQIHSAPAGRAAVTRNAVLLAAAVFVAAAGWDRAGINATEWVTGVPAAWLLAVVAAAVIAALVSFQVWFSLQLLAQNGRTLARLEGVQAALAEMAAGLGPVPADHLAAEPSLGAGLPGGGLEVGSMAPEFELEDLDGERHSLASLLSPQRPLMLIFSATGCGPCESLLPQVAGWQQEHAGRLQIALLAAGQPGENRMKTRERGLEKVVSDPDRAVAEAYGAHGTPMAVVIGSDGLIESPTVGGADAIATLVGQTTRRANLAVRHVPPANGYGNGNGAAPVGADRTSHVGEPAPVLTLQSVDGEEVALADLYGETTVALFWNPRCAYCQQMLPTLRGVEDSPAADGPQIVVISGGERADLADQEIRSPILLDPEGGAMSAFDAHGTPMAVLVRNGRIASDVQAGASAILALIASASPIPPRGD